MPTLNTAAVLWIGTVVLDIIAISRAIWRGQGVERTLAWLFAILAFPAVGAIAYLLFANPSIRRTTRRKRLSAARVRELLNERTAGTAGSAALPDSSPLHLAAALTGLAPSTGNAVTLMADNDRAFEAMESALTQAHRSIWVEYYLVRNDQTGQRFLETLTARAAAGVEVRFLYDAVGSLGIDREQLRALTRAGGQVHSFLPLNPLRRRWSVHLRNHRKLIVIDGELGFTGGMNVGDEYAGRARGGVAARFRDLQLALRGPAVADLSQTFAEDWLFACGETLTPFPVPPPQPGARSLVGIVPSGPDQEHNAHGLLYFSTIALARRRVYLTSPYFIPDEALLQALIAAALRGVDVRLLVPARSDVRLVAPASRSYYPDLIRCGVRVHTYQPSMLHAKTLVVDDAWAIVGSANADIRSFRLNFEIGALVYDSAFAAALAQHFATDLGNSVEITSEWLAGRGVWPRLRDRLARLLSPLM